MFYRVMKIFLIGLVIGMGCEVASGATALTFLIPKRDIPKEWTLIHGPQIYSKKTLFEHINGQAELYLKYGFHQSVFAVYQDKKRAQNQIELDVYDMGNVVQAFGVFSRFRNEDRPGGFGLDSFLDENTALFYKGRYYVMLYAAESNAERLRQFAKLVEKKITDPSPAPKEISFFSKNGLKTGSIQYYPEGLLGYQFLQRGFQGTYQMKSEAGEKTEEKDSSETSNREFKLFLAIFKNDQEAANALKVYKENLSQKGKVFSENFTGPGYYRLKGEDPYQGKVIVFQKGIYLLGAIGFRKDAEAEIRLDEFTKSVK